jgi:integrase
LAASVARAQRVGRFNDGAGLYLQVAKTGKRITKSWLFRYQVAGREHQMGLGSVLTYSLAEARDLARACRQQVAQGLDPIAYRKAERASLKAQEAKRLTFAEAMANFHADNKAGWRSAKHAAQWLASLRDHALPVLGSLQVNAIETAHVVKVLRPIWETTSETASRVRGRIESVLSWATANGFREGENPARWDDHLENILPKHKKVTAVVHHAAMPFDEVPAFMVRLAATKDTTARALEMLVLTAVRTKELTGARWDEINLTKGVWTIPASRTKAHREFQVPLSRRAKDILTALPHSSEFVFPGLRSASKPLDRMALVRTLEANGGGGMTNHGFRASFRTWAGERTTYPKEIAEAALGHAVAATKTEGAYHRGSALEHRRRLMEAWAAFCLQPQPEAVVTLLRA